MFITQISIFQNSNLYQKKINKKSPSCSSDRYNQTDTYFAELQSVPKQHSSSYSSCRYLFFQNCSLYQIITALPVHHVDTYFFRTAVCIILLQLFLFIMQILIFSELQSVSNYYSSSCSSCRYLFFQNCSLYQIITALPVHYADTYFFRTAVCIKLLQLFLFIMQILIFSELQSVSNYYSSSCSSCRYLFFRTAFCIKTSHLFLSIMQILIIPPTYELCQGVYSFCHSVRSSVCSFVRLFVRSFVRSLTLRQSFVVFGLLISL